MKKSNKKGFTLVELVVVIAIIGVLAAILVPSMMSYVKKSRLKTANSNAKTAYNAVSVYIADQEVAGTPVDNTAASVTFDCKESGSGFQKVLYDALVENGNEAGEAVVGFAEINGKEGSPFVQWRKGEKDTVVGQYPNAIPDVDTTVTWGTYVA